MGVEWVDSFVSKYGYFAVFFGSLIEGEHIIITASAFASKQTLSIQYVMLIAFIGTMFADQLLFHIGLKFSDRLLESNWWIA